MANQMEAKRAKKSKRGKRGKNLFFVLFVLFCLFCFPFLAAASAPVAVPEPNEKALSYYRSGIAIWDLRTICTWLILGLILFTGFSARLRDWAQRIGKNEFFTTGIYFAALIVILFFVIDLPFSFYAGYLRDHSYGLSNQTFGKWLGDLLKWLAITI